MGERAARQLLVAHAISDTTLALLGHGKVSAFKNISRNNVTVLLCETIESLTASRDDVIAAGFKLMTVLYDGVFDDSLNNLRYVRYMNVLSTWKMLPNPERLSPTENTAMFRVWRVYLLVVL